MQLFQREQNTLGRHERLPESVVAEENSTLSSTQEETSPTGSSGETTTAPSDPPHTSSAQVEHVGRSSEGESNNEGLSPSNNETEDITLVDERDVNTNLLEPRQQLVDLAAARSIRRRRVSICIVILSLLLLRLYIEAILNSDFGLFWACLILTSWLVRWVNAQRDQEEMLDARMDDLWQEVSRSEQNGVDGIDAIERRRQRRRRRDRQRASEDELDYRMLSFQAQLSMAIMESQRHILVNGGYGRPDGDESNQAHGVTEGAKKHWKQIQFGDGLPTPTAVKSEDQQCCICLSDYEPGDNLLRLPCGHLYHAECINSWCINHVKCPLCNLDLEEGDEQAGEVAEFEDNPRVAIASRSSLDSIV